MTFRLTLTWNNRYSSYRHLTIDEGKPMTEFTARHGSERYVFDGVRLASVTTDDGNLLRWTEITIYRTEAGKYVVEKIGRTLVYHSGEPGFDCSNYGIVIKPENLPEKAQWCPICEPPDDPVNPVRMETDRYNTIVTETAPALIDACRLTNNDSRSDSFGTTFLPDVARWALTQAAELDEGVRDAVLRDTSMTQRIA
jgi:hypothetical protein